MATGKPLTAAFVKTVTRPGRHGDGRGGLGVSLLVKPMSNGRVSKTWSQRLILGGRPVMIGLGSYPVVGLADARAKALRNAREREAGRDPRSPPMPTFSEAAERYIALRQGEWRDGGRTEQSWRASLRDHAAPLAGIKVRDIQTAHVLAILMPIWNVKPDTARKVKQRVSSVMQWCVAQNYRADDPAGPAVSAALPSNNGKAAHLKALPYAHVAAALAKVDASAAWVGTKRAIRFVALTACRSGEARGCVWDEIDMAAATWTIPAERMKTKVEHRVPLSDAAVTVLREAADDTDGPLVFPGARGKVQADSSLSKLLRDLGIDGTVHGLRSSFRDWAAETGKPREVAESALAHTVKGVEAAYFRSDLYELRRELMEAWADYLNS